MKFAQQLKALENDAPAEWKGKWLQYKPLKKVIKKCRNDRVRGHLVTPNEMEANDAHFFKQLQHEVKNINRQFEDAAGAVLAAGNQQHKRRVQTQSCIPFLRRQPPLGQCGPEELAARSAWCRQYALVNAAALRKVTKKHDKYCGGTAGSRFLQACWDAGHGKWGGFLHSPLMTELQALEVSLAEAVARQRAVAVLRGAHLGLRPDADEAGATPAPMDVSQPRNEAPATGEAAAAAAPAELSGGGSGREAMSSPELELSEDDFMCGICLGPMYKPLGLTCGHTFCAECVIQAAGLQNPRGPLKGILQQIPVQTTCPKCRQKDVFSGAVELPKLGRAIASRYTEDIQARADAAADRAAKIQDVHRTKRNNQTLTSSFMSIIAYDMQHR